MEPEIPHTAEIELEIDRTENDEGVNSNAEIVNLVISLDELESIPMEMEILPEQAIDPPAKYNEPDILNNESSQIPEAETEEEWRPEPEQDLDKIASDEAEESVTEKDVTATKIPKPDDDVETNTATETEDYSIQAINQRVNPRSSYIGSLFKCPYSEACKTWLKSEEDIRFHILRHHEGMIDSNQIQYSNAIRFTVVFYSQGICLIS